MPVSVSCTGCGKQLTVKDEYLGKRLKCPQCGATFTATAAQARSPEKKTDDTPRFHMSPGIIAVISIAVLMIGMLTFWKLGPGKVRAQWQVLESKAHDDITDVVDFALKAHMSQEGDY